MAEPVEFFDKKLPYDLSSHGELALIGRLFRRINFPAMGDTDDVFLFGFAEDKVSRRPSEIFVFSQRPVVVLAL